MGHATLWPVPRAIDAEAHHYPRHWKRNFFLIYGAGSLIFLQISRFGHICRQSSMANGEYMDWGSRHAPMRVRYNWTVVSDQINATYHCLFNFKIFLNALKMAYLNINHPSHLATSPQSIHPFKKLNLKLPFIN